VTFTKHLQNTFKYLISQLFFWENRFQLDTRTFPAQNNYLPNDKTEDSADSEPL
jgi:hypothetical protein